MPKGEIVLGALAPHPPHVVYAENPAQKEPISEGGWETLRWGYNRLARKLESLDYDAIVVFTPHWQTYVGTHFLGLPRFSSKSVDPIFPNIFRYNYDLQVDVELSEAMCEKAAEAGFTAKGVPRKPTRRSAAGSAVCTTTRETRPGTTTTDAKGTIARLSHFSTVQCHSLTATAVLLCTVCMRAACR